MALTTKDILPEFVDFLEAASCSGVRDLSSPFELAVTAKMLAQLEIARCHPAVTEVDFVG